MDVTRRDYCVVARMLLGYSGHLLGHSRWLLRLVTSVFWLVARLLLNGCRVFWVAARILLRGCSV